ncbi:MAG: ABC transporter permease [Gemmatimonadota bacterium]
MGFVEYLVGIRGELLLRTWEHILLVVGSTAIAVTIGVPLGVLLTRRAPLRAGILGSANILQTIPSLALLGLLIPLPMVGGIGAKPAIVALVAYALLPIIRNSYEGIRSIDPAVREAAIAMGMTDRQLLRRVEIPLALGVMMGGVRLATVIGIGVTTIAAAIGAGGLGVFIFQGLAMVDNQVILAGAIPAALLALLADAGLGALEKRWSTWRS